MKVGTMQWFNPFYYVLASHVDAVTPLRPLAVIAAARLDAGLGTAQCRLMLGIKEDSGFPFKQFLHLQRSVHVAPALKHSQYNFWPGHAA